MAPRISITTVGLDEIKGYERNPRDNSKAIDSVANSIQQFGFLCPIVVDGNMVIAAGHTRYAAAQKLGLEEVPIVVADHLTPAQIDAFRLIDNKVAEISTWDVDLLAPELARLEAEGLDFTEFGWSQEEIDCLSSMASSDCLTESASAVEVVATVTNPEVASLALAGNAASAAAAAQMQRERVVLSNPQSVGIRIGEVNFYIAVPVYEEWLSDARKEVNYDQARLAAHIADLLGVSAVADRMRAEGRIGAAPVVGTSPQALVPPAAPAPAPEGAAPARPSRTRTRSAS